VAELALSKNTLNEALSETMTFFKNRK